MARPKEFDCETALDRALELFWARGYEATSVQDLVEATGVQRQSLYDTFGGKHELYLAALRRYARQCSHLIDLLAQPGRSPLELVRDIIAASVDAAGACRVCMALNAAVERGTRDSDVAGVVRENLLEFEHALVALIERARRAEEIAASVDPVSAARSLVLFIMGIRAVSKVQEDRAWFESAVEPALSRFLPPR
jgi:TetR/AcrR family transcriptional repressor of nem operon